MMSEYTNKSGLVSKYYYDQWVDVSTCYVSGICIASLDHSADNFETFEVMTEEEKDALYETMLKLKKDFKE
jgi:hypothetical protein